MIDIRQGDSARTIENVDIFIISLNMEKDFEAFCKNKSKGLLKVLNKPILAYQLEFLDRNNIKKVFIITNKEYKYGIDYYLSNQFKGEIKYEILETTKKGLDIFSVLVKKKLTHKNFVLFYDDVIFNFDMFKFIDNHINQRNLVSFVLKDTSSFDNSKLSYMSKSSKDVYGVKKCESNGLYDVVFYNNFEDEEKKMKINKNLLKKEKNFNLIYNFEDVEFYIFNRNIFSLFEKSPENVKEQLKQMSSIKKEFIPFLISKIHSKSNNQILFENSQSNLLLAPRMSVQCKLHYEQENSKGMKKPENILGEERFVKISDFSKYISTIEEIQKPFDEISLIFFLTRNNNKNIFKLFEHKIAENLEKSKPFNNEIPELEMLSVDTYVGLPLNKIDKTCKIIRTVLGSRVTIMDGTKITNCLISDNAKIGKSCKINNCVIGENAVIGDNCTINDCIVQPDFAVADGVKAESKVLKEMTDEDEDIFNFQDV